MISFKYRDKNTPVHKLSPISMIAWTLAVFVSALIIDNPLFSLGLFLSTMPYVIIANVWKEWISFMKVALFICITIVVVNAIVNYNGSTVLAEAPFSLPVIGIPVITLEAIVFGLAMSVKLLAIMSAFAILTLAVNPDDLMRSIIKLKLPYKSVMVMSLSTRFVPTLIADVERIRDAQRTRGVEFDKGMLWSSIKSSVSVLIPLLSNSLDRAYQISEAMESRGFGSGNKRTFYNDIPISRFDFITIIFGLSPLVLAICLVIQGYAEYEFYPKLSEMQLGTFEWASLAVIVVFTCALALISSLKRSFDID